MLIKCPECGKDVSDKAPACIHCGFPLNNLHKKNICLVDGAEHDMTEFIDSYMGLTDSEKKELYENTLKHYNGHREIASSNVTQTLRKINEHFNWWNDYKGNDRSYLADKFTLDYIDHNFQYFEFNTADIPDPSKTVRCPKCGSTSVTTEESGYSLLTGFWGSSRKHNLCQKCGYRWKPGSK
jgi:endogenous inhibitor of DNA gyrase (YacG/DUF329 family)